MIQPRDPNHPIYKLINDVLEDGDQKVIYLELNVSQSIVSRVKCGKSRSKRIWNKILEVVKERKKQQDSFVKVMKKEVV